MPAPRNIRVRQSIPSGYIVGRSTAGQGGQQLVDMNQLAQQLAATGVLSAGGTGGGSTTLAGLTDVDTSGAADGDVFTFDSGSGLWVPEAPLPGGLFSGILTGPPTSAGTGLTTWANQGTASVANTAAGVSITRLAVAGSDNWAIRYKAAPATPYTIRALVSLTSPGSGIVRGTGIGWYDGTKAQVVRVIFNGNAAPTLFVSNQSALATFSANVAGGFASVSAVVWLGLADDGTNVTFSTSHDGINFAPVYTIAKASGYLGASGYANVFFGVEANTDTAYGTLLYWA